MAAKDAIIKRVYFDSGALGSIKRTLIKTLLKWRPNWKNFAKFKK